MNTKYIAKTCCCAILFLIISGTAHAQFFQFGFGDDFFGPHRQREQQVEITQPVYDGDQEDMEDFMKDHFKVHSTDRSIEGKIIIACIINKKGKVTETHVVRGLNKEYNEEACRVASKMRFKPGKRGKEKVESRYDLTFPIRKGRLNFSDLQTTDI